MQDLTFYLYIFFILLTTFIVIKTRSDNLIIQILIIIIFVAITGFRDLEVPDTTEYYDIFQSYNEDILDDQFIGQEIGFIAFGKIIKNLFNNYVIYFSFIALLNILLIRGALSNLEINKCLGMIAYISFYGLAVNFIFLRVGLAMSFFIYFFSLYQKGKGFLGSPFLLIAPFFHKSIIVSILSLPLTRVNLNRLSYLCIIFLSILFYFSGFSKFIIYKLFSFISLIPFASKYVWYVDNIKLTGGFSIRHIFNMLILFFVVYRTIELDKLKPILNICLLGLVLTSLLSAFLWVDRIADALVIFNIFILSSFVLERNTLLNTQINQLLFYLFLTCNMLFVSRIMTLFLFQFIV